MGCVLSEEVWGCVLSEEVCGCVLSEEVYLVKVCT